MNAFQIVEFINALPPVGVVVIDTEDNSFAIELDGAAFEAVADDTLSATGKSTTGYIATTASYLIDTDDVRFIKHIGDGRA